MAVIRLLVLLSVLSDVNESVLYGAGFLAAAVLCFALDIARSLRMGRCVQPCEGEFCGVINYEALGRSLNRPAGESGKYSRFFHVDSAVFRYWAQEDGSQRWTTAFAFSVRPAASSVNTSRGRDIPFTLIPASRRIL